MKTDCDIIRDLLPLYADKVCSESSRRLVEEHCAECAECSGQLSAMSAELPCEEKAGGAKNPLKKTKRHYLKLAFITALVAVPIAAVICVFGAISVNEYYNNGQISWSSIAAEHEMKSFGRMLKNGNYSKALSMVGFEGLDGVNRKNEGELLEVYTKIFGDFFSEYPISGIECKASNSVGLVRGDLNLYLDKKFTGDIPLSVHIVFERDETGDFYITKANVSMYDESQNYEGREDICREIYEKFWVSFYPGDSARSEIETALKSDGTKIDSQSVQIYTSRLMELDNEHIELIARYYNDNGLLESESESFKAEDEEFGKKYREYRDYYKSEVKRLFTDDYKLISVEGEEPFYCDEVYLENSIYAEGRGCFKQKFTLNMETHDGESFYVKFSSRVRFIADVPQDIEFSDNAPEEFKESFSELFK